MNIEFFMTDTHPPHLRIPPQSRILWISTDNATDAINFAEGRFDLVSEETMQSMQIVAEEKK